VLYTWSLAVIAGREMADILPNLEIESTHPRLILR